MADSKNELKPLMLVCTMPVFIDLRVIDDVTGQVKIFVFFPMFVFVESLIYFTT